MVLDPLDVKFTYSGGPSNFNPDNSLGGESSIQEITGNTLFDDVQEIETINGMVDYRCFYFVNDSAADTLFEAKASFAYNSQNSDVTIQIGFNFVNDIQLITIPEATDIASGGFVIIYNDLETHEIEVELDPYVNDTETLPIWGTALQNAIREVPNLEDVTVSVSTSSDTAIFAIQFAGTAGRRYHELFVLDSNTIVPAKAVNISKQVNGSPINSIADDIDVDTTPPSNVNFYTAEIQIGDIRPIDVLPVWIKRTVPAGTVAVENDGFIFRLSGSSVI